MLHIIQSLPWLLIAICLIVPLATSPAAVIVGKAYGLSAVASLSGLAFVVSFLFFIILGV